MVQFQGLVSNKVNSYIKYKELKNTRLSTMNSSHDAITFAYQYLRYFSEAHPKLFPFPPQAQTRTRMNTKRQNVFI